MPRLIAAGGFSTELSSSKATLGEGPGVDITLPAGLGLAPIHAELRPLLGGYVVKHLGGDAFQTLVNDKPVSSLANLTEGDIIRMGKIDFTLELAAKTSETQPAATPAEAVPTPAPVKPAPVEPAQALFKAAKPPIEVPAAAPIEPERPPIKPAAPAKPLFKAAAPIEPAKPPTEAAPARPIGQFKPAKRRSVEQAPQKASEPATMARIQPNPEVPAPAPEASAPPSMPPLPTSGEAARPIELPPLPAILAEAAPSPGNEHAEKTPQPEPIPESPPESIPLMAPSFEEAPPAEEATSPPPIAWNGEPQAEDVPGQNVAVKLAPPARPIEKARRKHALAEFLVPGIITLIVALGGIVYLLQHNKKLAVAVNPQSEPQEKASANQAPTSKPVTETKFVKALDKLGKERQRPRYHEFPAENFLFNAPGNEWMLGSSNAIPGAQVTLENKDPNFQFAVIGEALGEDDSYTENDLREVVKGHMMAFTPHLQFINKGRLESKGLSFGRFDARARLENTKRYIVNISLYHQGFFYQLITFGDGDGHHEAEVQEKALGMMRYFDLIDRERTLALNEDYRVDDFKAPYYGYTIGLNRRIWEPWQMREFEFPGAHMAAQSAQSSVFGVMPMHFKSEMPSLDDLTTAFLASMGIPYPSDDVTEEAIVMTNGQGRQIIHQSVEGRMRYQYQLQVIRRGEFAYLLGGWSPAFSEIATREIPMALKKVSFQRPNPSAPVPELSYGQRHARSVIFHHLGVQKLYTEELDLALNYFKQAVDTHPAYYEVYTQLVRTFASVGRNEEGLAYFKELVEKRDDVKAKAALALMHCHAGELDEGKRQYEALFAQDFHDQAHFLGFMQALASARRYDEALDLVRTAGAKESSSLQALFEGSILNDKGDFEASLTALEPLAEDLATDPSVMKELVRALVGLGRKDEAFALADSEISQADPALAEYIRGVCHEYLESYEDAKACFAKAARLDPLNRHYQTAMLATSSVMGQGDSSMVKTKLEAVPMPESVQEAIRDLDTEATQGASERYHVSVIDYRKGRPYKSTAYRKVKAVVTADVRALSTLQYGFHPTAQQIYVNYLLVRDASGEVVAEGNINETFITDVPVTDIASDGKILHVPVPGLAPGYELEVAVTVQNGGTASSFGFHREIFASEYPTAYRALAITGDIAPLTYHSTSDLELKRDNRRLVWSTNDLPRLTNEPNQAPLESFVPVLYVGEATGATWQSLGDDYLHSVQSRLELDEVTRSTAQRVISQAKASTPRDKLNALGAYVQQSITYKGIEFGQRALMPNKSEQIIADRYGDCKDHSLLLHQLLQAVGVPSHLVLIDSRRALEERFPNMSQFNHMILAVPLDGKLEFVDCTNKFAPIIGRSADTMAGQRCLVLREGKSTLESIPSNAAEDRLQIHHAVEIDSDGLVIGKEVATLSGTTATRYRASFAQLSPTERRSAIDQMLRVSRRFEIRDLSFSHLEDPSQSLEISLEYTVQGAFQSLGGTMEGHLSWPLEALFLSSEFLNSRRSPVYLPAKRLVEGSLALTLPTGYATPSWKRMPQRHDGELIGWQIALDGEQTLSYKGRSPAGIFPASKYQDFRQGQEGLLQSLESRLILTKGALAADSERD